MIGSPAVVVGTLAAEVEVMILEKVVCVLIWSQTAIPSPLSVCAAHAGIAVE